MRHFVRTVILFISIIWAGCSDSSDRTCDCSSPDIKDSITVSNMISEGIDSLLMDGAIQRADESGAVYSLMVLRNGGIVSENYFNGMTARDSFSVRSVTKSVIGTLIGVAVQKKLIKNEGRKLNYYFPEYFETVSDPLKNSITIKHLLTMTSGFQWNEASDRLYGNYIESAISLPMSDIPGAVFNYNSSNPHLLSGIITRSAKVSTLDFANTYLFEPLNISIKRWDVDPDGYYLGGTGLFMTTLDMAKVGFLYLNHGCYLRRKIISDEWITETWSDHISNASIDYGYLWWITEGGGHKIAYAFGYGGELIYVIEDLQLIVVFTANPDVDSQTAQNTRNLTDDILISNIITAIKPYHAKR